MKVFLTGATGLLGVHLVRQLLERGHEVHAMARNPEKARRLLGDDPRLHILKGDLEDPKSMHHGLAGCDTAILAGAFFTDYYRGVGSWETFYRVNVEGALDLLREAKRQGLKKAVFVSSCGALNDEHDLLHDPNQMTDLYRRSKVVGEMAIRGAEDLKDWPIIIARPGWIFGPEDPTPTSTGQMALNLAQKKSCDMVTGTPGPVVDARDVAAGLILMAEQCESRQTYNIGGHNIVAAEALQMIARHIPGSKVRVTPFGLAEVISNVLAIPCKLLGKQNPLPLEGLRFISKGQPINSDRAKQELGWEPRPFEETARNVAAWAMKQPIT